MTEIKNIKKSGVCILLIAIYLLSPLSSTSFSATPEPPSIPPDYVVDLAGIIRDDIEAQLNSYLMELEEKTTAQVAILTINSLDGEDIEGFSHKIAERWRLGKKDKDNGLLITIALHDRAYRFEVGYGLESILPDSLVGSIGRQYLVPYFRRGDYTTGILNATLEIIKIISQNYGVEIYGFEKSRIPEDKSNEWLNIVVPILSFIVLILTILQNIHLARKRGYHRGSWFGGFGGGGFGGFGGGGFSGGGGGFGGGGASGRW